jgi:MHS family proline/betaine transporter-like MFS transporter
MFHLPSGRRHIAVVAGVIGNIMEWYDFALYGFMAQIISRIFFPEGNQTANLLATYGIFAAGFIMRPLGSVVFGWLGDTIGRSRTMLISVSLMTVPTFLLGLLPPYAVIGLWAPLGLVLIRLVQGLSVGGEFSSSVTYLVETAPQGKRGLSGSWANVGSMAGMLLGSGMASLVMSLSDDAFLRSYGWRIPFLFAAVLGSAAIYLRRNIPKSEHFTRHEQEHGTTSPVKEAVTTNLKETVQASLFASAYGAVFYISLVYIPTWLSEYAVASKDLAMNFNTGATALVILLAPLAGWLSDRYIRRTRLLAIVFFACGILAVPLHLWMMSSGSTLAIAVSQFVFGALIAFPCGIAPAVFVELFPTADRLSGYSIAFNLGLGVIGGSTPMAATWLISKTDLVISPGIYMAAWSGLAVVALFLMRDRSREPLREN